MKNTNTKTLTRVALLVAIEVVMKLVGLGSVPMGPLYMSFLTLPIAVGAITMGPAVGALLGGGGAVMDELQQNGPGSGPLPVPLWLAAVLLLAVLALYAVSWRVSVAWYGKYKK